MKLYKTMGGSNAIEAFRIYSVKYIDGCPISGEPKYLALFIAGNMPPNQRATLEHGFKSKKDLLSYCDSWGIALYSLKNVNQ